MKKIEHIGIAVEDMAKAEKIFSTIFGKNAYKWEEVISESVKTTFFKIGESKIELVSATNTESPIAKFLEKNREGMHHIAFAVEDIEKEMERLKKEGIRLLNDNPKTGADNKLICFLHPKDTAGVLIELCQGKA
ncbi:MAG TPA: methylmalonyl-CoA epimerase [Flavobacteriales bacterium]|jgi:methylmalonyl-CoA/ethylmalonyl-CoA epimerase|nr:methylmalonyl-CoA epimerase [Flavobacteriales bacterium]HIL66524.1 methylmalonyl-CoA epimerase [Flavobacteriales bacterium]|tara:strand:+ start:1640 stop:2041 length:402 start_codon:yes stop_codon:yes gene_type:complete